MITNRKIAILVGALFLFSNVTFLWGAVGFVEPILGAPDYLSAISANRMQVVLGALLEIVNGIAYIGIAVLLFPILKQRFESIALGYVGFRIVEFVMQIASSISPLILVTVSEQFVKTGAAEASSLATVGALLVAQREWGFQMVSLTFGLGAVLFYYMLYHLKLIPRFISIWGLVGVALVLVNLVFDMFGISLGSFENLGFLMLLNELFLGIWLIVKGFNSTEEIL